MPPSSAGTPDALDAGTEPAIRLVVGLGNPGAAYAGTRHNVGFMVLDHLAARAGERFRREPKWGAEVARVGELLLCKPARFMNLSGGPTLAVGAFFKIPAAAMLVVVDDAALPLGRLRLRPQGSAGGHRGLESIIGAFATTAIPRLRVGIGAATGGDLADHVLARFAPDEAAAAGEAVVRAAAAVAVVCELGLTAAMNQFNKNE